jgi:hypothetical protein
VNVHRSSTILAVAVLVAGSVTAVAAVTAATAAAPATCAHRVASDFNGDGYGDLVTGDPQRSIDGLLAAGSIQVDYGGTGGIDASKSQYFDQSTSGVPGDLTERGYFGKSIAVGWFNGDCYADIAVGAAGLTPDSAGSVTVLYGSSTGIGTAGAKRYTGPSDTSGFGWSVAAGDFNADGYTDVVVGAPGTPDDGIDQAGEAAILYGGAGGLGAPSQWIGQDSPGVPGISEKYDRLGWAVTTGDFNGDGYADAALGTPYENDHGVPDAGAVRIVYGSAAGIVTAGATSVSQSSPGVPGVNEDTDRFG